MSKLARWTIPILIIIIVICLMIVGYFLIANDVVLLEVMPDVTEEVTIGNWE